MALRALSARAADGLVVGVDSSAVMLRQARRRNRAAVRAGRVKLVHAAVEDLGLRHGPFDAALAVDTAGLWPDPAQRLRDRRACSCLAAASRSFPSRAAWADASAAKAAGRSLEQLSMQAGSAS